MKYLPLLLLVLVVSCGEEETPPKIECQLDKTVTTGTNYELQTVYTYDASGKMLKMVRTRGSVTLLDNAFSYNADGRVDKVDYLRTNPSENQSVEYEYATDGKIAATTTRSSIGNVIGEATYTWTGNNVKIEYTSPQLPNPYQVIEYEFTNENLVKTTAKSYTGQEPNEITYFSEVLYENYDTGLSASYVSSSSRPGYGVDTSKNNPGKLTQTSKNYDQDGQVFNESSITVEYTYTYNQSNVAVTSMSTTNGTDVTDTVITYSKCN